MLYTPTDPKHIIKKLNKKVIVLGIFTLLISLVLIWTRYAVENQITLVNKAQTPTRTPTPPGGGMPTATPTPGGPVSSPTPTPTAAPWIKVRNADFHRSIALVEDMPLPIANDPIGDMNEDPSDPCNHIPGATAQETLRCFNVNQPGIVSSAQNITMNVPISKKGWKIEGYTLNRTFTPAAILQYVKARKKHRLISSLDSVIDESEVYKGEINLITGNYSIDLPLFTTKSPFVLIVDGDLYIDSPTLAQANTYFGIVVTGKLNISEVVVEMRGIYIADTVDFAYEIASTGLVSQNPLRIIGNLIVNTPTDTIGKRRPAYPDIVPIFVIVDAVQMMHLYPYLSIKNYQWEELAP